MAATLWSVASLRFDLPLVGGGNEVLDLECVRSSLAHQALTADQVSCAISMLPADGSGLLLYGSRARDDFLPESDVDLIAVVPHPRGSLHADSVNLSCYTIQQLTSISGTLFAMHLRRDAVVIADASGTLEATIRSFDTPHPDQLFSRIRHFSAILNVTTSDVSECLPGLIRLSRYLLRTAIYAEALRIGQPCFSIRELALLFGDPDLSLILSSGNIDPRELTVHDLADLRARLEALVGPLARNPHGSLARLAVIEWDTDRDRAALAILAMSNEREPFDYSELPKVLL